MNLDIFFNDAYFNKLKDFISIEKVNPVFPFREMFIDPDNLVNDLGDATSIYNFLINVKFFYYYSQRYIGYTLFDNKYYVIFVDDEINILLAGDDEVNWTKLLLNDNDYFMFKDFCLTNLELECQDPDYKVLGKISRQYLDFY